MARLALLDVQKGPGPMARRRPAPPHPFGELLRRERRAAGLTQQQLSDLTRQSVTVRTISDLERGLSLPRFATSVFLADALGLGGRGRAMFMAVGRGETALAAHPEASLAAAVCTLPLDVRTFVGRDDELGQIAAAARAGGGVRICAIRGMAGIGKTALALHAGYLQLDGGLFPDRQLFVDLRGHSPLGPPLTAERALELLLTADGVHRRYLPDGLDERAAIWRGRMAGKHVLLILDNALSSDQVVPLLPGTADSLVLVTSRRHLGDLPSAQEIQLEALPPDDALAMFLDLAPRAAAETEKIPDLLASCRHLPLAISLVAPLLSRHETWGIDDLIEETVTRLLTVRAENRTIAAAFDLSYEHLTASQQLVFRRLALHPGPDVDDYAAAALTGWIPADAIRQLDSLHADGLLVESAPRRYRMHDLLRRYARDLAVNDAPGDDANAVRRLIAYYEHAAVAAGAQLARYTRPKGAIPTPDVAAWPQMEDPLGALRWLNAEVPNLLACIDKAAAQSWDAQVVGLTAALAPYLRSHGPWSDAMNLHSVAAAAAARLGDGVSQAAALNDLAILHYLAGDNSGAIVILDGALHMCRELGDSLGQANVLCHLGTVFYRANNNAEADKRLEQAFRIYREIGDRLGEANALSQLGVVRYMTGKNSEAAELLEHSLRIYRDVGNLGGEADACAVLCAVSLITGHYAAAEVSVSKALAIYRDLGEQAGEAQALHYLGQLRYSTGDLTAAAATLREALGFYRKLADQAGEANVLNDLGNVRRLTGDDLAARDAHEQALLIYQKIDDSLGEANALNGLGAVSTMTGEYEIALAELARALEIYENLSEPAGQAEVLNRTGWLHMTGGRLIQAHTCYARALTLARDTGNRLEEARALEGLGRYSLRESIINSPTEAFGPALEIYQNISSHDAVRLSSQIDTDE